MNRLLLLLSFFFVTLLSSCELAGGIFKAGVWVGILVVVLVIALIVFLATRGRK